jgi:ABC-type dipeptide/oligopeptide/nickel transport system permease subunit
MERQKILMKLVRQLAIIFCSVCIIIFFFNIFHKTFTESVGTSVRIGGLITVSYMLLYLLPVSLIRHFWRKWRANRPQSNTLRIADRFIRNPSAMFGTLVFFYAVVLFILAHIIAPDPSPFAARQINELAFRKPGYTARLFILPVHPNEDNQGFFTWLIQGKETGRRLIAINHAKVVPEGVEMERFLGEGIPGQKYVYTWAELGHDEDEVHNHADALLHTHLTTQTFWLGTDDLGRDYLSRVLVGVRVSLAVGFVAVFIALLIGVPIGAFAGFYKKQPPVIRLGKRRFQLPADGLLMWTMSVIWAIPTLLLVFPIVFAFGQQFYTIFIAVGLTMWVDIARVVRGQVMQVRELEYIEATKSFGYSHFRTIFRHILPNITGPVIVITAANFAYAILTEAGLSFLGIGVQPPAPSWGLMISKYKDNLITDPYLALIPGIAITVLVLAFFLIGNGLRDAMDNRIRS